MQELPSVTETVIAEPVGTSLIVHKLPLVLTTVPEVLVTAPELTVTPTEYVNRSGAHAAAVVTVIDGKEFTDIVIPGEAAGLIDVHVRLDVSRQVTISPLASAAFVYDDEFDPTLLLLSFHW
jgi:hypothetical protein